MLAGLQTGLHGCSTSPLGCTSSSLSQTCRQAVLWPMSLMCCRLQPHSAGSQQPTKARHGSTGAGRGCFSGDTGAWLCMHYTANSWARDAEHYGCEIKFVQNSTAHHLLFGLTMQGACGMQSSMHGSQPHVKERAHVWPGQTETSGIQGSVKTRYAVCSNMVC